jgi:mannose-1-phosphate guanylyltransferase
MDAVVMCGGFGKRLRPLTYYFQKCMMPVGSNMKPILDYVIKTLKFHGFYDMILVIGHKGDQIRSYFGDGHELDMNIIYHEINPKTSGLVNSFSEVASLKHMIDSQSFLLYMGDILTNINLNDMRSTHIEYGKLGKPRLTLACGFDYSSSYAFANTTGVKVTEFTQMIDKRPNIGIMMMDRSYMKKHFTKVVGYRTSFTDIIEKSIINGDNVFAYPSPDIGDFLWYDVGSVSRYEFLTPEIVDKYMEFVL